MSTETVESSEVAADLHAAHEHTHPSDKEYYVVAGVLAFFTVLEVLTYYVNWFDDHFIWLLVALIPLMIVKFAMVVAFFMHLRFDNKLLRRIFITGVVLATSIYLIVFFTFHWFGFQN